MCDDVCRFPATISIGSLLCVRAPGIRPALSEEQMAKKSKRRCDTLPILHPDAAGIDVSASELFVPVSADRDPHPVRSYPTFTRDLHALDDWLVECGDLVAVGYGRCNRRLPGAILETNDTQSTSMSLDGQAKEQPYPIYAHTNQSLSYLRADLRPKPVRRRSCHEGD